MKTRSATFIDVLRPRRALVALSAHTCVGRKTASRPQVHGAIQLTCDAGITGTPAKAFISFHQLNLSVTQV